MTPEKRIGVITPSGISFSRMSMSDAVNEGRGEGEAKAILAGIPQEERQEFVSGDIRRILQEEPSRLVRNFWPHFIHVWKAQWVEDYFVKVSFFTRPLRETWALGALGDILWLVFSLASVVALADALDADIPPEWAPGGMRLMALGWIAYSCLTVMLIHVEPRYLLPIWMFMALYGSAALATLWAWLASRRRTASARAARATAPASLPCEGSTLELPEELRLVIIGGEAALVERLGRVAAEHDVNAYLNLLARDGNITLVGAPPKPLEVAAFSLIMGRRTLSGSNIGGIAETQEMLDFCGEHNITADVEVIPIQKVNEAYDRLLKSDVKYRFSIDMASLKSE